MSPAWAFQEPSHLAPSSDSEEKLWCYVLWPNPAPCPGWVSSLSPQWDTDVRLMKATLGRWRFQESTKTQMSAWQDARGLVWISSMGMCSQTCMWLVL